jgi:hypothetical protein
MPTKEIDEIIADLPEDAQIEAKPSLAARIGAGLNKAYKKGRESVKYAADYAKIVKKDIERAAEKRKIEYETKPNVEKLAKQTKRVQTLKKQISEAEERGTTTYNQMDELEQEEKQLRDLEEKMTDINVEDLSDRQLKILAVRHKDTSFFGSGNEYEGELVRRIEKTKQINMKIKQAARKPVEKETGLFADFL